MVVSNPGDLLKIHNVVLGIAHGFDVKKPRVVLDRPGEILWVVRLDKRDVNTDLRKRLAKQRVCPAVKGIGRYEVLSGAADIQLQYLSASLESSTTAASTVRVSSTGEVP